MRYFIKRLEINTTVIISTKENPTLFLPAKIEHIIEINQITPSGEHKNYQYNVRPVDFEKKPFQNFLGTDTTFLEWKDLEYLGTIDGFNTERLHYVKDYITKN